MQTNELKNFEETNKQLEALGLMGEKEFILLEGGSRSGKTFIIIWAIIYRALKYSGSRHLTGRLHFSHAKNSLWYGTIKDALDLAFPGVQYNDNKSDWFISFPNGSEIWLAGFDDKERIEKILGNEYATIHLNEASQISYETFETLKTRLNPPKGVRPLMLIDYNPPSKKHWGYKVFHLQQNPENETELLSKHKYGVLRMNPADNLDNLNESYMETLEGLGDRRKRRFFYGEYSDDTEGALWKREWIHENRVDTFPDLRRIVVSVDPAVTNTDTSDDTGIIVVGTDGKEFYVLADYTYNGDVTGWGMSVVDAYKRHKADKVVAEQNQGGDLVKINIRNYDKMIPIEMVHATRGKAIRAEPVADLYNRGLVHHVGHLIELEDELCEWTPEEKTSPNRLDALVWGITFLAGGTKAEVNLSTDSIKALWGVK